MITDDFGLKMTHSDVEHIRHMRGQSILLFITDRCPVGCAHCSVDSRADSPTISNFKLFNEILDWICAKSEIRVVGISGGEPFVERRGLTLASERFMDAHKRQVIYTSGVWAREATPPHWIREILGRCSCVYLSTDTFHAKGVSDERFLRAAHAIADSNTWIVVQVLNDEKTIERAELLLQNVFGKDFADFAELNKIVPLMNGRGANVFEKQTKLHGHQFGPCSLVASPMVRYDGLVTGCCNESVIMNFGPSRLRRQVNSMDELVGAVEEFHADPLLRSINRVGLGVLTKHPLLSDLAEEKFTTNCQLCWKVLDRMPNNSKPDHLINAISLLEI